MGKLSEDLRIISIDKSNMTYKTSDGEERGFLFGVDDIDSLTVEAMNEDLDRWLKIFSDLDDVFEEWP